jgi:hypothetical protein
MELPPQVSDEHSAFLAWFLYDAAILGQNLHHNHGPICTVYRLDIVVLAFPWKLSRYADHATIGSRIETGCRAHVGECLRPGGALVFVEAFAEVQDQANAVHLFAFLSDVVGNAADSEDAADNDACIEALDKPGNVEHRVVARYRKMNVRGLHLLQC